MNKKVSLIFLSLIWGGLHAAGPIFFYNRPNNLSIALPDIAIQALTTQTHAKNEGPSHSGYLSSKDAPYRGSLINNGNSQAYTDFLRKDRNHKISGVTQLTVVLETPQSQICPGSSTQIVAQIFGGNGSEVQFSWTSDPPGFTSANDTIFVSPTVPTTHTCIATQGSAADTASTTITLFPTPPQPQIQVVADMLVCVQPATLYNWYLNGVLISSSANAGITPTAEGLYTCTYEDQNGCLSQMSAPFNFSFTSVQSALQDASPQVFPNPASSKIFFKYLKSDEVSTFTLFDSKGKAIKLGSLLGDDFIDLSDQNSGFYVIRLSQIGQATQSFKFQLNR